MQSLYANSPEGKKKDSFAVPLAEMTKTFIEQVKGIKPKEKPKEKEVFSGGEAKKLAERFAAYQLGFLDAVEVTPQIVYDNEKYQKQYILAMQTFVIAFFMDESPLPQDIKNLGNFLVSLKDSDENRAEFAKELNLLAKNGLFGKDFNADLVDNFLALYNVLGDGLKESYKRFYDLTKRDLKKTFLNPALFESEMEVTESPDNEGGTSTTLPSFIKPISYDKPSKPQKPYKIKFEVGDKYQRFDSEGELDDISVTIEDVEIDQIKVRYSNGQYGLLEINKAESYVKNGIWKKIEEEKPEEEFKVGDVYYSKFFNQHLTIIEVTEKLISVHYQEEDRDEVYAPTYCRLMVSRKDWIKVVDEQMPEQEFKVGDSYLVFRSSGNDTTLTIEEVSIDQIKVYWHYGAIGSIAIDVAKENVKNGKWQKIEDEEMPEQEQQFKVGDNFITSDNQDLIFTIDFIQPDSIGVIYFDGLTSIINPEDFKKGLKSGYYKTYVKPSEETDLYFKQGDEFISQNGNQTYRINIVDKFNNFVQYTIFNKAGKKIEDVKYNLEIIQENIKRGGWIKKDAKPSKPIRPIKPSSKPTTPTTLSDKDKQIKHILDINIEDIDF
jgi:hypothetical protein